MRVETILRRCARLRDGLLLYEAQEQGDHRVFPCVGNPDMVSNGLVGGFWVGVVGYLCRSTPEVGDDLSARSNAATGIAGRSPYF